MLVHPADPESYLIELADLRQQPPPPEVERNLGALLTIAGWAREYLSKPHEELGRDGPVCPYTQPAMSKGLFYMTVRRGAHFTDDEVRSILILYRDWFLELEPVSGSRSYFKTILILFPDVSLDDVPRLIDAMQERLKPEYVAKGLMVGEFHPGPPDKAGLWNPDFRPLAAPIPMLVIRNMVPTDFGFLRHDKVLVEAYLSRFRDQIPAPMREDVRTTALGFGISLPEPEEMAEVHPRVREVIAAHGLAVAIHRHRHLRQPTSGPHEVAAALGYPVERITKSLFVRAQGTDRYLVLVCPVNRRIDLRRVAMDLGLPRLELASERELSVLGFSPGGVSPIAVGDAQVVIDEEVMRQPTILTGAGEVKVEIELDPRRLREVTGARVMALTSELEASVSHG